MGERDMDQSLLTQEKVRTAFSARTDPTDAVRELVEQFGAVDAGAVLFFASPAVAGATVAARLVERFPGVPVIGCTSAGEFTRRRSAPPRGSPAGLPRGGGERAAGRP